MAEMLTKYLSPSNKHRNVELNINKLKYPWH